MHALLLARRAEGERIVVDVWLDCLHDIEPLS
jgi:hypothetical protein